MGSDFGERVTVEQAAKMLGRSRRTVTTYMKNGILHRHVEDKRVYLLRSQVEQLQIDLGADLPPMNRKTFYQLSAHVRRLEMDMAVLKRVTGFYDSPLRPSVDEAQGIYAAAKKSASEGVWQVDEIRMWADLYDKMDDVFFDVLALHTEQADAWRPLYELCLAQSRQLSMSYEYRTDLQCQHLHDRLQTALSRMRKVILVWIEAGNSPMARAAEDKMDGDSQAVLRRLTAKA
jgi:hypothetical protein